MQQRPALSFRFLPASQTVFSRLWPEAARYPPWQLSLQ